jgi:hypothetical protein
LDLRARGVELYELAVFIGEQHDVNTEQLRQHFIQSWLVDLEGDGLASDADRSVAVVRGPTKALKFSLASVLYDEDSSGSNVVAGPGARAGSEGSSSSDILLQRAVALLRMGPLEETVLYLLNFALEENSVKITPRARVRAFFALFMVASPGVVAR